GRPKSMRRAGRVDFTPAEIVDAALADFRRVPDREVLRKALIKATKLGIKWDKEKLRGRRDKAGGHLRGLVGEDAPVNNAGGGEVAGIGVGADGEPGVDLRQPIGDLRKRRKRCKEIKAAAAEAGLTEEDIHELALIEAKEKATRIASGQGVDFWKVGDEVYRASTGVGLDIYGVPNGARWESSYKHWLRYRKVHAWAKDVTEMTEDASDTFAGGDVMDVDLERVLNAMAPKKPWERFSKYVGIDEVGENIRLHARKNWKKNIILRDAKTGIMTYLRRR
ncbi:uncharacterized protein METZ01_LOCUS409297, partial [marine metagenome]